MLAGPEAQTRIQHDEYLVLAGTAMAPGRFDQEPIADFDGGKMTSPGPCPILATQFCNAHPSRRGFQSALHNPPEPVAELSANCRRETSPECRFPLRMLQSPVGITSRPSGLDSIQPGEVLWHISRYGADPGFRIESGCHWLAQGCAQQMRDGILGFGGRGDRNSPENGPFHAGPSRHGVKLSNSISFS